MKILYISQYFPPEMGAPSARASELARHWADAGHDVSILTGFPNHPTGIVPAEWRSHLRGLWYHEKIGGVNVYRTWLWALPNRKAHERMRNYASFFLSAALRGMFLARPDVIIASSPQLLVGLSGWWLAFAHQIPFVFEVRDLWPESLAAVGLGGEDSLLYQALAGIAGFLYDRADRIVVVTDAFKNHLVHRWRVPTEKIDVVENGVETDLFTPSEPAVRAAARRELGADSHFVVSYIGTMGMAHGLETLLNTAAKLQSENPNVVFVMIGEGAEKARIKALAESLQLKNVHFLDQQPREKLASFISASDACVVLLRKTDVFKTVIPTKMLEFMSCARPVILGVEGEAQQIVLRSGAGLAIEPDNAEALASAIQQLAARPNLCQKLGQNGRGYIVENFSRASTAQKYMQILDVVAFQKSRLSL